MVDLTIAIVSWNVRSLLERSLGSLPGGSSASPGPNADALKTETIVVDNGSDDGSPQMVQSDFPDVRLVANRENRGFAAANNQAIKLATGRYVILLNPDTEIAAGALSQMVAFADSHPDVGVVGPQLRFPDGSVQPSRYRFPTVATAVFESTWLQPYAPGRLLDRYYVRDQPDDRTHDVDWVRGAALMVRREAFEQVGVLDECYFMYSEELDWCRRMRAAGWRVVYLPSAQVIHHEGKSSEQAVADRHINFQTSKVRYFRKHHGDGTASALRAILLIMYVWQMGVEAAKWLVGSRRGLRERRLASYRAVVRSRLRSSC